MKNYWLRMGMDMWSLGMESSNVIALRTLKLTKGGAAGQAEADLMVREKINAGLTLTRLALTGGLGATPHTAARRTVAHYRRKVRANARRLSKHD